MSDFKKDLTFLCQEMSAPGKSGGEKERQAEMQKAQRETGRIGTSFDKSFRENMVFQATLVFFFFMTFVVGFKRKPVV